jgi:hypothetical protein
MVVTVSFVAALFSSALLLFAVQPIVTRMVLPRLGGSPSVWSVAMVFFQLMLLAGAAYAHVLTRITSPARAVGIHLALIASAALTLPLTIGQGWAAPAEGAEWWLLRLLVVSFGLPFLALSANTPLLQAWFVRTGHPHSNDPYFLYVASNAGSLVALLSYPVAVEPALRLQEQRLAWSGGFWLQFLLVGLCAYVVMRFSTKGALPQTGHSSTDAPSRRRLGRWMFLAAVPSGLLVAVTAHISTDVAAAPLLWVVPLAMYLLTWILVFQRRPLLPHRWLLAAQPIAIAALIALMASGISVLWITLPGHLLAFFVMSMASHGELARLRPPARHLTTFYLALSAGGLLGGLFAGLAAPLMFSWVAEYPILIALAPLCRPRRAFAFAAGAALLLLVVRLYPADQRRAETRRSFFGVHKVYDTSDGRYRVLVHGTTVHGAERLVASSGQPPEERPEPLTYYHARSPFARAIAAVREHKGGLLRVAAIGLGAGSLACYIMPGEMWRFFEIDPIVAAIARDARRFTFLSTCAPDVPIVLGDARLTLAREPNGASDLIIIDAYSSDAIPVHLATREAMAMYQSKLAPDGVIAVHVSNRHLDLTSVVAGIAAANGRKSWKLNFDRHAADDAYVFSSEVVFVAARAEDLGALTSDANLTPVGPASGQRVWTDDYSNVAGAIARRYWPALFPAR